MAGIELEDLEVKAKKVEEFEEAEDGFDIEVSTYRDLLLEALSVLRDCGTAFDFMANRELVRNLSKRERDLMNRLSDRIQELAEVVTETVEE